MPNRGSPKSTHRQTRVIYQWTIPDRGQSRNTRRQTRAIYQWAICRVGAVPPKKRVGRRAWLISGLYRTEGSREVRVGRRVRSISGQYAKLGQSRNTRRQTRAIYQWAICKIGPGRGLGRSAVFRPKLPSHQGPAAVGFGQARPCLGRALAPSRAWAQTIMTVQVQNSCKEGNGGPFACLVHAPAARPV